VKPLLHILLGTERGGCETNAMCFVTETPDLAHQLLVLGKLGPMSADFAASCASVHHAEVLRSGSGRIVRAVEEAVRHGEPSGVIVWHGMVCLPEILHALRDFKGRILVHGGNPAHSMPWWVDWRYLLREKWLGRRADATYVCCSRHVADSFLHSRYLRRFPRAVVPNGVKEPTVPPQVPREIAPGDPAVIGMVARLDSIKDHPTLLRAFTLLQREWPTLTLELAGDGDRRSELETLARELGIGDHVRFLGSIDDVFAAMARWDLFVYATTEREGLGNALAEAMRLGMPCVVTNVGPMREVAGDPATVQLVQDANPAMLAGAIKQLLSSADQRRSLGSMASTRASSEFSGGTFARRYLGFLFDTTALP
jgi:glycosyltransferase involved in cell wall biosynthesis